MFLIVNGLRIRPVEEKGRFAGLVTVEFMDAKGHGYTRVHPSRLYPTEEEAQAALEAYRARMAPKTEPETPAGLSPGTDGKTPYTSREMERRWLLDHCGSPDP